MTDIYGILAYPASHSLSPHLHNAAFRELGINARYDFFEISPDKLSAFMDRVRREPIRGLSVSLPYKEKMVDYVDETDEIARGVGAVNTIVNDDGVLRGFNTDAHGAIKALEERIPLQDKNVVILGAGGAARAIAYGLKSCHAHITLFNRTREKAQALAESFSCDFGPLEKLSSLKPDILIQASNVGMNSSENCIIDPSYFSSVSHNLLVFDIVYTPLHTKFIRSAREAGLQVITGDRMFLHQAEHQYRIWTKHMPPSGLMERILKQYLS